MIMLRAAAHTTQALRRRMVEQAAAVKVRTAGTETHSLTDYATHSLAGVHYCLYTKASL